MIEAVAHGERERKCGIQILESLPFYARSGIQGQIIADITPTSARHYWNMISKLKALKVINVDKTTVYSLGKRKRLRKTYTANAEFLDVISSLFKAWKKFMETQQTTEQG